MRPPDLKEIPGFEGYFATRDGRVFSTWGSGSASSKGADDRYLHEMVARKARNGYLMLQPRIGHRKYLQTGVHRLICLAFRGPAPIGYAASHLNGNRADNRSDNLIWESYSDNLKRRVAHGTDDYGHHNSRAILSLDEVREIRKLLLEGVLQETIAAQFGVGRVTITKINIGDRYKHDH